MIVVRIERDGRIYGKKWNWGSGVKSREERKVNGRMRFVSESLPTHPVGLMAARLLPQTPVIVTKPAKVGPPILAGFRTLCCLTSEIGRTSTLKR
ncbi:hypothetical protein K0M31_007078 [Melipona bicolor]|uniref:Uncharacterized protein n=1 Tax=Melipona bicolor TaxID=60889 RepID=A0AA40FRQ6_9HYME|nr:hypothetical protein K0M31_007078 [Melipona bicolor]